MHATPFIFSNERKWRLRRHAAFWGAWWLFSGFIYSVGPLPITIPYFLNLLRALTESVVFFPSHMFFVYAFVYVIVPKYLVKGRYLVTVIAAVITTVITACLSIICSFTFIDSIRSWFSALPPEWVRLRPATLAYAFMAGVRGGMTIGGLAAAIKLMKYYYVKEQRNLQLQKEKAEAQLQLLKAQVHPHFLFNTLNNIYSHTQGNSPRASQLVMGLSEMLRYMLYEGNQSLVPLSKELKMIQDYIYLEKIRYDDHLDVHIDLPANTDNIHITPLLLLPLVENCFKHGTSNMLEQPWLSLQIRLEDTVMHMKLINGKPVNSARKTEQSAGIGIKNVQARLELLYPGKHVLQITDDPDVFVVKLQLQLERKVIAAKKESNAFILSTHE